MQAFGAIVEKLLFKTLIVSGKVMLVFIAFQEECNAIKNMPKNLPPPNAQPRKQRGPYWEMKRCSGGDVASCGTAEG